jgi:hypothetical protein
MSNIAIWSLAGIVMVFLLGLVSALQSRRLRKITLVQNSESADLKIGHVTMSVVRNNEHATAMSMAAKGTGNVSVSAFGGSTEENLAAIGSNSR